MKGLLVACVLLAACDQEPEPTNLVGSIACGESTCDSGAVCVTIPSPIQPPAGYDDTECWMVPAGCEVYDCEELGEVNTCATCVIDKWYPCAGVTLEGRELFCMTN